MTQRLRDGWAAYVRPVEWEHFATLTFRYATPLEVVVKSFHRYIRFLERAAQQPVDWFIAPERTYSHHWHAHALLTGTGGFTGRQLTEWWMHGRAEIERFDPARGAAYYMCKQVSKDQCEVDISRRLKRLVG